MFSLTRLAAVAMLLIAAGGCQGMSPAAPPAIAQGDYPAVVAYLKPVSYTHLRAHET